MSSQAFEHLMLVKESAYGTPMSSPVAGTDSIYIRLTESNAFTMIDDPIMEAVPYGGGWDEDAEQVSDHAECKGKLTTLVYPAQAAFLFGWALTRVNAGQTAPWTTTELPGDLASVSCYHAFRKSDGSFKRERWAGTKVLGLTVSCSRSSPKLALSLDLQAQKPVGNTIDASSDPDATEFPLPNDSDLPTGPFVFRHSGGNFSLGGSVRSAYESLSMSVQNKFDPRFFEGYYLQLCGLKGRKSTLDADLLLKPTPDDRASYRALTSLACSVAFGNGTHTLTLNYHAKNTIGKLPRDLPLGKEFLHRLNLINNFDPSAGTGIDFTYA
jgi:hypothetical protein